MILLCLMPNYFTLPNAKPILLIKGEPLGGKGLNMLNDNVLHFCVDVNKH